MWLTESGQGATRILQANTVESAAQELLAKQRETPDWSAAALEEEAAYETMQRDVDVGPFLGWALLDSNGLVVASDHKQLIGSTLAIPSDASDRLATRQSTVCRPIPSPVSLRDEGPLSIAGAPIMCAMAPLANGARTVGSLALLINPLDRFNRIAVRGAHGANG